MGCRSALRGAGNCAVGPRRPALGETARRPGHFTGKDSLLAAVVTEGWERIADQVHTLRTDPALDRMRAAGRFEGEFLAMVTDLVGERSAPH